MATQALDQYRELFARLEREDSVPLLFHCTAGKDRTGVGSALILLALGVPEKTVMWDYMLTGFYTSGRVEQLVRNFMETTTQPIDLEAVKPILSVRREYLGAAFEAIRDGYGTVDRYLEEAMFLTKPRLEALRERLLR
jgi:protein-tyrosine phosphatase